MMAYGIAWSSLEQDGWMSSAYIHTSTLSAASTHKVYGLDVACIVVCRRTGSASATEDCAHVDSNPVAGQR